MPPPRQETPESTPGRTELPPLHPHSTTRASSGVYRRHLSKDKWEPKDQKDATRAPEISPAPAAATPPPAEPVPRSGPPVARRNGPPMRNLRSFMSAAGRVEGSAPQHYDRHSGDSPASYEAGFRPHPSEHHRSSLGSRFLATFGSRRVQGSEDHHKSSVNGSTLTSPVPWANALKESIDAEAAVKPPPVRTKAYFHELILTVVLLGMGYVVGRRAYTVVTDCMDSGDWVQMYRLWDVPMKCIFMLFGLQTFGGAIFMSIGPLSLLKKNSQFFSAVAAPLPEHLPKVSIQMPVYKESLIETILPTIESLMSAVRAYRRLGGTASIFVNDDGLQLLDPKERDARVRTYEHFDICWVARPPPEVRIRRGRFKKASNMNYCLNVAMKVEDLVAAGNGDLTPAAALDQVKAEYNNEFMAGGDVRIGEIILLVDSDTRVPQDCLSLVQGEFAENSKVGYIQCRTAPLLICDDNTFESFIGFFTEIIYDIGIACPCAMGTIAPLVGHNAFLRWSVLREISTYSQEDRMRKVWSEAHVSEDFDLSLRMFSTGFIGRYATYTGPEFKEGVSLTVGDEMIKLRKFAFGACEMVFNPFKMWITHGPLTKLWWMVVRCRSFPWHSKVSILAYLGTYFAMGATLWSLLQYYAVLTLYKGYFGKKSLGQVVDDQFSLVITIVFVFFVFGNFGTIMFRYRSQNVLFVDNKKKPDGIVRIFLRNAIMAPKTALFFSGLLYQMTTACFCYFFSLKINWGSTVKEIEGQVDAVIQTKMMLQVFKDQFIVLGCLSLVWAACLLLPYSGWQDMSAWLTIFPWLLYVVPHFLMPFVHSPAIARFFY